MSVHEVFINGPFSVNCMLLVYWLFGGPSVSIKSTLYTAPQKASILCILFIEKGPFEVNRYTHDLDLPDAFHTAMEGCCPPGSGSSTPMWWMVRWLPVLPSTLLPTSLPQMPSLAWLLRCVCVCLLCVA